jgi:hypothetical protein
MKTTVALLCCLFLVKTQVQEPRLHWTKVIETHKRIVEIYNNLSVEQEKQFHLALENIVDVRQTALVSRLTRELKKQVDELEKLNR